MFLVFVSSIIVYRTGEKMIKIFGIFSFQNWAVNIGKCLSRKLM